jgi:membrane protein YdbS with pleckstrin-like domain
MRPNLNDPAEAAAYRQELRRVMRVPRIIGFLLVAIGAALVVYAQRSGINGPLKPIGFGILALGWLNLFAIIYYRTRYHKARMKDDPEAF